MVRSKTKRRRSGRKGSLFTKRLVFVLVFVVALFVLVTGIRLLGPFHSFQNRADWALSLRDLSFSGGTNYLLYGAIEEEGKAEVEELLFLNYPPENDTPNIIIIPGNLLMHRLDEDNELQKSDIEEDIGRGGISRYYTPADFYDEGGTELLVSQVSHLLNVPIHYFLEIDHKLIADAGNVKGEDEYGEFFFQEVTKLENEGFLAVSSFLREISPYFNTNQSWDELQELNETLEPLFDSESIIVEIPGDWKEFKGEDYLIPDQDQVASIMENLGQDFVLPRDMITVEVLNGCGISGIAGKVGETLKDEGFEVVNIDNADHQDYQRSQVISRVSGIEVAREVALNVSGAELFKDPVPDHQAMVTVIIGNNY